MKSKQEFRRALKERRASITPEQHRAWDRAIVERIVASEEFRAAETVLLYAPTAGEINLLPLARVAWRVGKRVAFPRCDKATTTIQFYTLAEGEQLVEGAYGIPEPSEDAALCVPDAQTLCILPALTFDPSGARLGYGKGYYDRFLEGFEGTAVGAVYEFLRVREVPTEEHDRAVSTVFTERATYPSVPRIPAAREEKQAPVSEEAAVEPTEKMAVEKAVEAPSSPPPVREKTKILPLHAPAALVAATFLLLLLSRPIGSLLADGDSFTVTVLLQLLIFAVPAAIYLRLRERPLSGRLRLGAPRLRQLWFCVCLLIVMILASLLAPILTGGIESLTGNFTLYDTFVARMGGGVWETVGIILAYAVLPAVCEELIFRAILCAEYERYGAGVAIAASAIFFAMLHFSLPLLLSYLISGALLALAMYATRSLWAAIALHLLYNLFCLFGQPYLSAFYVRAGNNEIFLFCLVTLLLLFAAFAAGEGRKIYHAYARENADASYAPETNPREIPRTLLDAARSPAALACLVIWLTVSILGLLGIL